ncbi:MAG: hypothetical protein L6V93_09805 [Clostridiales bacterium]|nr:MAG: hypothetical protein L6V93_09805 [Clostridiales bacterium]
MPDGDFPTLRSPNPEENEGFKLAIELAKKVDADVIIATDPDSDRVGVTVKDKKRQLHHAHGQPDRYSSFANLSSATESSKALCPKTARL